MPLLSQDFLRALKLLSSGRKPLLGLSLSRGTGGEGRIRRFRGPDDFAKTIDFCLRLVDTLVGFGKKCSEIGHRGYLVAVWLPEQDAIVYSVCTLNGY